MKQDFDAFEIIELFLGFMNPDTAYSEILRFLTETLNADSGQIIVRDWETGTFETHHSYSTLPKSDLDFSTTILDQVLQSKEPMIIADAVCDPSLKDQKSVLGKSFLSVIAVPILDQGESIGALYLDRRDLQKGLRKGPFNHINDLNALQRLANKLSKALHLQWDTERVRIALTKSVMSDIGIFWGNDPIMRDFYHKLERYAQTNSTMYISGETGVGKEWVANALHLLSPRKEKPFIVVDCTQLSNETAEVKLFGSIKGAYTDAIDRAGAFELADGGTIFLDEIGELPLEIQPKLLRVLEKGSINRICFSRKGSEKIISVDACVVVATNRNLDEEVAQGKFRYDLLTRVKQLELFLPPLRERKADILPLALAFLDQRQSPIAGFTSDGKEALIAYNWPGNVRELKSTIEKAVIENDGKNPITRDMLFPHFSPQPSRKEEITSKLYEKDDIIQAMKAMKHKNVLAAVKKYGSKAQAAQTLGLHRQTIYHILWDVPYKTAIEVITKNNGDFNAASDDLEITPPRLKKILEDHPIE